MEGSFGVETRLTRGALEEADLELRGKRDARFYLTRRVVIVPLTCMAFCRGSKCIKCDSKQVQHEEGLYRFSEAFTCLLCWVRNVMPYWCFEHWGEGPFGIIWSDLDGVHLYWVGSQSFYFRRFRWETTAFIGWRNNFVSFLGGNVIIFFTLGF